MKDGKYGQYIKKNGVWKNEKFTYDPKVPLLNGGHVDLGISEQDVLDFSDEKLAQMCENVLGER